MKIILKAPVFNPTGIATANRELAKALMKEGVEIQTNDIYVPHPDYKGLDQLNYPVSPDTKSFTIFAGYPQFWQDPIGIPIVHPIHEGTKLPNGWSDMINRSGVKCFVCSKANKNLFRWNGVNLPIEVINYGFNPEIYKNVNLEKDGSFVFLSINSWTGEINDRKGTDLLIRAFDEEFKDEDVKLVLKISTFWQAQRDYKAQVVKLLGHENPNIMVNQGYLPEEKLATHYQNADCFVAPTKGEGFGLTLLNSLACGCPVIVTKDKNSGHMDFCENNEGVIFIKNDVYEQGDKRFLAEGNMLAKPSFEGLKQALRWAFEHRKELQEMGKKGSEFVKDFTWENSAKKIIKFLEEKNGL